jgi:hypothetical protein
MSGAEDSALSRFLDAENPDDALGEAAAAAVGEGEVYDSLTAGDSEALEGACVECEESPGVLTCDQCDDVYCKMCHTILHRKGHRSKHTHTAVQPAAIAAAERLLDEAGLGLRAAAAASSPPPKVGKETHELGVGSAHDRLSAPWFAERCKFVPIRLKLKERKMLRLFVASLSVSDYTGRIDKPSLMKGAKRLHQQMREMCSAFTGLTFASGEFCSYLKVVGRSPTYSQIPPPFHTHARLLPLGWCADSQHTTYVLRFSSVLFNRRCDWAGPARDPSLY